MGGNWVVGGSFAGTTKDIALDYAARQPAILVRDGDHWQARRARVLDNQADQEVTTLLEEIWTLQPPD